MWCFRFIYGKNSTSYIVQGQFVIDKFSWDISYDWNKTYWRPENRQQRVKNTHAHSRTGCYTRCVVWNRSKRSVIRKLDELSTVWKRQTRFFFFNSVFKEALARESSWLTLYVNKQTNDNNGVFGSRRAGKSVWIMYPGAPMFIRTLFSGNFYSYVGQR